MQARIFAISVSLSLCSSTQLALQLVPLSRVRLTVHALYSVEDTEIETVARSSIVQVVLTRQYYIMVYSCLSKAHRHASSSVQS